MNEVLRYVHLLYETMKMTIEHLERDVNDLNKRLEKLEESPSDKPRIHRKRKVAHSFKIIDGGESFGDSGPYAPGNS